MSTTNQQNEKDGTENKPEPKNHVFMLIFAVLVVIFFIKFVVPAMDADTRPPSSMLTGEEYDSEK